MVITKPTIDDFSDTTVMRVIRKIVEYIIDTLVPAINEGGGGSSYVLPPATKSTLGGIIVGDNLTVDGSGKVNAPAPYTLPIGGTNIGGVKNGGNVTIESDGTMNVEQSGSNIVSFKDSSILPASKYSGGIGSIASIYIYNADGATCSGTFICGYTSSNYKTFYGYGYFKAGPMAGSLSSQAIDSMRINLQNNTIDFMLMEDKSYVSYNSSDINGTITVINI